MRASHEFYEDTVMTPALLDQVVDICQTAGQAILEVYNQAQDIEVITKDDDSPLTAADLAAHKVLVAGLEPLLDGVPILSEEGELPDFPTRQSWGRYWIIDPLDGTKEFIKRSGEFTVNVALIENGVAILGVVHVPVLGITYSGLQGGETTGAWKQTADSKQAISARKLNEAPAVEVVASRSHGADEVVSLLDRIGDQLGRPVETKSMGSSLKLCLVAEGEADLYPRLALTCEWDTAAAQAVVEAAGGQVLDDQLQPLRYNQKDSLLNPFFYVIGDTDFNWSELLNAG